MSWVSITHRNISCIFFLCHQRGWGWAWARLIICFCCLCQRQYLWLTFPDSGSRNRKPWFPIHFCLHFVLSPLDSTLHWPLLTLLQHLIHKSLPSHWFLNTTLSLLESPTILTPNKNICQLSAVSYCFFNTCQILWRTLCLPNPKEDGMAENQYIRVPTQGEKKLRSWFQCQCLGSSSQDCSDLSQGTPGVVPCQTCPAPAGSDGPTAVHGWAHQPGRGCLHEHTLKGRKGYRERGEENKRSEKLHRKHQGERGGREMSAERESSPRWSTTLEPMRELQPVEMT